MDGEKARTGSRKIVSGGRTAPLKPKDGLSGPPVCTRKNHEPAIFLGIRRRESGKSTPLIRIACYDPTTSTSDQVYGGWPTLRSLKGGIPRTPLSWDSESRCTTR